ncbi:MAG TPA: GAF domain-containing protein [Ktedonobacterales bacterium]|nr:GAF domain-containing protein [Ktedonobacterales bacterium]
MTATDVHDILQRHEREMRQHLSELEGDGRDPEPGSDAALLLDALCGMESDVYLPAFETSARRLAEQGGRLEMRLIGIQRWQAGLAHALDDVLAHQPAALAKAQEMLGALVAEVVVVLAREYQIARQRQVEEETERARRGASRLQALQRINAAANSTLDLDQTLATAAEAVAEEMGVDLCAIYLFDDISRDLDLRATNGPYPRGGQHYTLALGQGYTGWVAEHGHPLLSTDAAADNRFSMEANLYGEPYRGLLSVPIIFFTVLKLEGVISVQTREPRVFSDADINFLEIAAGQLAMNIENGRLYEQTDEELRRKVHELSTLHRVSALVTSTLVLDNVLRIIVSQAVQLSGADRSILFELDPATQHVKAVASHGFDDSAVMATSVRVGQCCVGRVTRSGEPSMQVDCMRTDEGCFLRGLPDAVDDQHAVLCAPLVTMHGALGALCVFSGQRHMLNAHQLQLVVTFANVAAISIENARLFEQTRQGLRTKEALLREMHHRVKNNLQQVASILNMQRRRTKSLEVEQTLLESVDRIQSIVATHDLLSNTQLGSAPVDEIVRKIVGILRGNLVPPQLNLRFHIGHAPYPMPTEQATTLAIVLNELIANAIEHGFEGRDRGEIRITGVQKDSHIVLRVADDGQGVPEGFSLQKAEGLGLQLVNGLVRSTLRGSVEIFSQQGNPDLTGSAASRRTDPLLPAVSDGPHDKPAIVPPPDERTWTIAEMRFPVALLEESEPGFTVPAGD